MNHSPWPPAHVAAAGVLITDELGRVLMVRTHHRTDLILPGGIIESGESPAAAALQARRDGATAYLD